MIRAYAGVYACWSNSLENGQTVSRLQGWDWYLRLYRGENGPAFCRIDGAPYGPRRTGAYWSRAGARRALRAAARSLGIDLDAARTYVEEQPEHTERRHPQLHLGFVKDGPAEAPSC